MAVKEKLIEDKLDELILLQDIDSEIDKIQVMKGELPMEVQDLEDEIEGLRTRKSKLEGEIEELNGEINNRKQNKVNAETYIQRYKEQLNNVKNNREYEALSKEIELQELEIQLNDKKIGDASRGIESKNEYQSEIDGLIEGKEKNLADKKVELEKIIKSTEKEEKELQKKSEKARVDIESRLLKAYDRIRKAYKNGLAVVKVERESCGGCYASIPPQRQLEIRQRKRIIICEHCGRILTHPKTEAE